MIIIEIKCNVLFILKFLDISYILHRIKRKLYMNIKKKKFKIELSFVCSEGRRHQPPTAINFMVFILIFVEYCIKYDT